MHKGFTVIALSSIIAAALLSLRYPASWAIGMGLAGAAYGALSSILHARGLLFVAGASPHVALASAGISSLIVMDAGTAWLVLSLAIGVSIIMAAGYMIERGFNADDAAAFMASLSSTAAVLALYRLSAIGGDVAGLIIGDPLLVGVGELVVLSLSTLAIIIALAVGGWRMIYIGMMREESLLGPTKSLAWSMILYLVLGLATVGMLRIVGYVLEHVLLLLPGIIASQAVSGWRRGLAASAIIGLSASITGLIVAVNFDVSPSGASGAILVLLFLMAHVIRGGAPWRRGGSA
ncbi:MAG: metal ABC transporter permease [Desulfurococcales archaeon]|nr:metal ABC transporter permease [Desulfurococcales archaeon]